MTSGDRVALVTGGSRGIGAATCVRLARSGWDVALSFRERSAEAEEVAAVCRRSGGRVVTVPADVSVEADVLALFEAADAQLGTPRALVNNAGVVPASARVEDYSAGRVSRVLDVNVLGPFLAAREAVRRMSTAQGGDGGVIVNVSSRASGSSACAPASSTPTSTPPAGWTGSGPRHRSAAPVGPTRSPRRSPGWSPTRRPTSPVPPSTVRPAGATATRRSPPWVRALFDEYGPSCTTGPLPVQAASGGEARGPRQGRRLPGRSERITGSTCVSASGVGSCAPEEPLGGRAPERRSLVRGGCASRT